MLFYVQHELYIRAFHILNDFPEIQTLQDVQQFDAGTQFGNVGLDSVNKPSRDEDNILDQYVKKNICVFLIII